MDKKNCMAGWGIPLFLSFRSVSSDADGGISGVVRILHKIEPIEHIAPRKKEANTQVGSLPVLPMKMSGKINNETLARVCPKPVKKL